MLVNSAISSASLISQLSSLAVLTVDVECSSCCGRLTHPVVSTTRVVTAVFTPDIVLFMVQRTEACGQLHTAVLADNGHGGCGLTTTPTAGKGHCVSLADSGALWPRSQLQADPCGRVWKNQRCNKIKELFQLPFNIIMQFDTLIIIEWRSKFDPITG